MRRPGVILLLALVACSAGAQSKPADQMGPLVPKGLCTYNEHGATRHVKADPPIEEMMHFDQSALTEHRAFFPRGTTVWVNRYEGSWVCVTGPFGGPTSGWPFRTGWMKTDLLGPVEEQLPASVTYRTKGQ
jgi:hypothetical protein